MLKFIESHNRVRRAENHARVFTNAYIKFLHDKPYGITHEMKDDRNGVIKLVPMKTLEWDLPLILGEYFYQLRAALDGAMWHSYDLCRLLPGAPKIKERDIYFPIYKTSDSLKNSAFKKILLPNNLGTWLDSIQPCHRSKDFLRTEMDEVAYDLLMINERSSVDRHRQMHLVGTVIRSSTPLITLSSPGVLTYVRSVAADPLKGQYEICAFGIEELTTETEINVDADFSLQIKVEEIHDDVEIMVRLYQLIGTVSKVIAKFEEAFK